MPVPSHTTLTPAQSMGLTVVDVSTELAGLSPPWLMDKAAYITLGGVPKGDGLGALYYYDAGSTSFVAGLTVLDGPGSVGRFLTVTLTI